jgi:predicted transport protein
VELTVNLVTLKKKNVNLAKVKCWDKEEHVLTNVQMDTLNKEKSVNHVMTRTVKNVHHFQSVKHVTKIGSARELHV